MLIAIPLSDRPRGGGGSDECMLVFFFSPPPLSAGSVAQRQSCSKQGFISKAGLGGDGGTQLASESVWPLVASACLLSPIPPLPSSLLCGHAQINAGNPLWTPAPPVSLFAARNVALTNSSGGGGGVTGEGCPCMTVFPLLSYYFVMQLIVQYFRHATEADFEPAEYLTLTDFAQA